MNKDLRKRFEEAAKESVWKEYQCKGKYHCLSRTECEMCEGSNTPYDVRECGAGDYKEGFHAGAEQGYKEAIEQAKEWLHNNLHLYIMSGSRQINYTFLMDGLEKAMNKIWEGEK